MNLNEECQVMFDALAKEVSDLPESQIATLLMTASLRALRDHEYRMSLPLRFEVVEEVKLPVIPSGMRS